MSSCPIHFHAILYFPQAGYDLNKIVGNAKRLIAYEIIERLKKQKQDKLLKLLSSAVTETEKSKDQLHKAFEQSFDAKQSTIKTFSCRSSITLIIIL